MTDTDALARLREELLQLAALIQVGQETPIYVQGTLKGSGVTREVLYCTEICLRGAATALDELERERDEALTLIERTTESTLVAFKQLEHENREANGRIRELEARLAE